MHAMKILSRCARAAARVGGQLVAALVLLASGIVGAATVASVAVMAGMAGANPAAAAVDITGAGATFPYPVYAKWAEAYKAKTGVAMNYQSIGSGGGIKQIEAKTVDFGASDKPLEPKELDANGLMQFPMIMGGVVPVVNIKGIGAGQVKLKGAVLADIYLGKIKKWNDPAIKALNGGLALPDEAISVIHRSDGSGTTFIFTHYLSEVSPEWKQKVGEDASVAWPTGVGGKGNEGVASYASRINGAIGYVEYAYALQNKLAFVLLQNKAGKYVKPSAETFQAAAANADWAKAPGFYLLLTNQPGAESWPITGASFILVYKNPPKPEATKQVLDFFDWAYHNGAEMASQLDYVPIPVKVIKLVEDTWKAQIKAGGKPVWNAAQIKADGQPVSTAAQIKAGGKPVSTAH
jgi:phosphate transport system substrate-binding protein